MLARMAPPAAARVTPDLIRPTALAVARGFQDNEIWEWIVPDDAVRARMLPRYYEMLIERVFLPRGEAWAATDADGTVVGGALWNGPGDHGLRWHERLREAWVMRPTGWLGFKRGGVSEATMKEHHPRGPHLYLLTLSIEPEAQRRGFGSVLMKPLIDRADAERLPVYLETQRESNVPFYRRFGFELTGEVTIPGGPPMWLMWREPAGA